MPAEHISTKAGAIPAAVLIPFNYDKLDLKVILKGGPEIILNLTRSVAP